MKIFKIVVGIAGIGTACYVGWKTGKFTYEVLEEFIDELEYEDNGSLGCEIGCTAIGLLVGGAVANGIAGAVAEIIS